MPFVFRLGTPAALRWPLTSVKPGNFGPKVLQIVDFLTGRVTLNLYGKKAVWLKISIRALELTQIQETQGSAQHQQAVHEVTWPDAALERRPRTRGFTGLTCSLVWR